MIAKAWVKMIVRPRVNTLDLEPELFVFKVNKNCDGSRLKNDCKQLQTKSLKFQHWESWDRIS